MRLREMSASRDLRLGDGSRKGTGDSHWGETEKDARDLNSRIRYHGLALKDD